MPSVVPTLRVQVADPIAVFGIETAHDASYTDCLKDVVKRNPYITALRYDSALDCLMILPEYKPQDTALASCTHSSHTGETWKEATTRATGKKLVQITATATAANTEWSYTQGTSPNVAIPDGGGLWITLGRSAPVKGATIDSDHCYLAVRLCATSQIMFRIVWRLAEVPRVEKTTDAGAHWVRIGDIPVGDISKGSHGMPDILRFQILRANGKIAFRATASNAVNESALTVPDDLDLIYPLQITGMNTLASIMHFPITFANAGILQTDPRAKMWVNDTTPTPVAAGSHNSHPDINNAPDGVTLTMASTGNTTTTAYRAVLAPQSTNTISPWLTYVQVDIPAIKTAPVANPTWTDLPYALGFALDQIFFPEQLTVRRGGSVTARNNPQGTPNGNAGLYAQAYGMRAVRVIAGLDIVNPNGTRTTLWSGVRFVGWLGAQSKCNPWEWTGSLTDRIEWELEQPLLTDVQFDGSCMYWTAKALAERGGFQDPHFVPVDGVPDAWTCNGTTCNPATHLRLGQGTVDNPSFAYTADQTVWEALQDIAIKYGCFCGVSSDGRFEFFPFSLSGARDNWVPDQVFSSVPQLSSGAPVLNEFIGQLEKHVDLARVRNSVTLVGMDKDWRLFASHQLDSASIAGGGGSTPPVNFLGRMRSYVDSSSRYYDPDATDYWCQAKFNLLRQPRIWFDPMDVWAQPLFPLDYIGIAANWTLPGDDCFYIGSMHEEIVTQADENGAIQVYNMTLHPELVPY